MDIIIILIVGIIGYYLSNMNLQKSKKIIKNINQYNFTDTIPKNQTPVSRNIYNSKMAEIADNDVLQLSIKNYKESKSPNVSAILPPIYNSFSNENTNATINTNANNVKVIKELTWQERAKINSFNKNNDINTPTQPELSTRPMFKTLLNLEKTQDNLIKSLDYKSFGQEKINEEKSLLTGLPIQKGHINMVPFFGGSIKQNVEEFTNEARLDGFTGNKSTFFHKKEALQQFNQVPEYGINGSTKTPSFTNNIDLSRYIPSQFKQGEKPFNEENVAAPISFTIDNPVTDAQISYKNIDELRVANKPQISYDGRIIDGINPITLRGKIGEVSKNKNDTSFELGKDRFFTSTGAYILPTDKGNYDNITPTCRQSLNINYNGPAMSTNTFSHTQSVKLDDSL